MLQLPNSLQKAIDQGIEFFMGEEYEWKLKIEGRDDCIEKLVGCQINVFANNGFGDNLFLKINNAEDGYENQIYEFFHEGPEINEIEEGFDILLGLKDRSVSKIEIPKYSTGEQLMLGDKIQYKSFFLKKEATITYVPGISKRDPELESEGIVMSLMKKSNGDSYTLTIDPKTNIPCGSIVLLSRK